MKVGGGMRREKFAVTLLTALCVCAALPVGALAHDWYAYQSDMRPLYAVPFAFAFSAAAEYAALIFIARVTRSGKCLAVVIAGNALAFGAACALYLWLNRDSPDGLAYPAYILGWLFIAASFVIEVLIEAEVLKNDAQGGYQRLIWTLLLTNAVTAAVSAAAERMLCPAV